MKLPNQSKPVERTAGETSEAIVAGGITASGGCACKNGVLVKNSCGTREKPVCNGDYCSCQAS